MQNDIWNEKASNILKSELVRKNIDYNELSILLNTLGIQENYNSIANKLSRGTFSFAFFLKCMEAIKVATLKLD
ncbi:MAG TPA: hypothetical protein EYG80_02350 [Flavobacteriaceae bacterium]|nr:hypothetical protein [Flavobacteriaceae bacterium]